MILLRCFTELLFICNRRLHEQIKRSFRLDTRKSQIAKPLIQYLSIPVIIRNVRFFFQAVFYKLLLQCRCIYESEDPGRHVRCPSLFEVIAKLKAQGKIIIYVSHRMKEIQQIADKVAIFKDGHYVDTVITKEVPEQQLIKMMVGRDLGDIFKNLDRNDKIGDVLLEVKGVSSDYVKENSFVLHKGEVLGFSGLVGAGRTELMRAIIGADKMKTGEVYLEGKKIVNRSPKEAMDNGIVLVPEDRKLQGILSNLSIAGNINIALMDKNSNKLGVIDKKKEAEEADWGIREFKVKTPSPDKKIVELSGGNQQKCIVARGIATNPKVLILDEPTKGIDVGAKSEFYSMICKFAKQGLGVILISSEMPEVIGLSDRIIVMKSLRISGEVMREEATEDKLLSLGMMGEEANE